MTGMYKRLLKTFTLVSHKLKTLTYTKWKCIYSKQIDQWINYGYL